ncbi:MAG: Flp pilus assembly complex ATPase component TadA [Fibrobacter sp.]|mgnify:CR=1 FL=1|nr:Flp pilus assembly complex ATPase component TadA [Fibrobacter sp.]
MRNQYMAKVLVHNKVVTEDQINAYWNKISDTKDIGQVLVDAGVIPPPTYIKVLAFVKNLEAKAAAEAPKQASPAAPATSSAAAARPAFGGKADSPYAPASGAGSSESAGGLQIEGNNLYGESSTSNMEVEAVAGLEATSISSFQVKTELDEEPFGENGELPSRFAIALGDGKPVDAPEHLRPMTSLPQILAFARKFNATDVYLFADRPIIMRQSGALFEVSEQPLDLSRLNERLDEASKGFSDGYKIVVGQNFSKTLGLPGAGRARITVTWSGTTPSISLRVIPTESTSLENLYLPPFCNQFAELSSGLVLIAGPAASGRSTTLITFAEAIAANRDAYIQTVEKPIERLLQPGRGAVAQREVGLQVRSGIEGIELAMRSGADVLFFDHLEKNEELYALLQAANAGTLVFAVTAGNNIHSLLSRIINSVPEQNRASLANALADQLKGVIVQHLVPVVQNQGLVLACEAMKMTSPMANLLRRGEIAQLSAAISSQKDLGVTLDDSLQKCVETGYIEGAEAWRRASDARRFAAHHPANS